MYHMDTVAITEVTKYSMVVRNQYEDIVINLTCRYDEHLERMRRKFKEQMDEELRNVRV